MPITSISLSTVLMSSRVCDQYPKNTLGPEALSSTVQRGTFLKFAVTQEPMVQVRSPRAQVDSYPSEERDRVPNSIERW